MTINITRRGNAVGFTSDGRTVCGGYCKAVRAWQVWIDGPVSVSATRRLFSEKPDAIAHARTLVDSAVTARLAWWTL